MSISPWSNQKYLNGKKPRTQKVIEEKHRQNVQEKLKVTKPKKKKHEANEITKTLYRVERINFLKNLHTFYKLKNHKENFSANQHTLIGPSKRKLKKHK